MEIMVRFPIFFCQYSVAPLVKNKKKKLIGVSAVFLCFLSHGFLLFELFAGIQMWACLIISFYVFYALLVQIVILFTYLSELFFLSKIKKIKNKTKLKLNQPIRCKIHRKGACTGDYTTGVFILVLNQKKVLLDSGVRL